MKDLAGKTAFITGAASGIGLGVATALSQAGVKVMMCDIEKDALDKAVADLQRTNADVAGVTADVSLKSQLQAAADATIAKYGEVHIVHNNAGVAGRSVGPPGERIHQLSEASVAKMFSVNLMGVFLCLKHEIAQMLKQGGGGAIVNTASIAGLIGLATSGHYVATKHGVVGLTKTAAIEYAQDGIRVNCVNPGYIKTPMTKETMDERYDEIMAKVPVKRLGVPEEIAEAVVWMCSDKASFMTGASHVIDGGYSAA